MPSPQKGEATRERIVGRALELAGEQGLSGLTIGELAVDLGLSKSGLFAHFKSKERLQLEVLAAAAEHFARTVFLPAFKKPRGEARLQAIFDNWLKWIRSDALPGGCIFIAGAMEWDDREGPLRDAIVHWFEELYTGLEKAVSLAVAEGQFERDLGVDGFASEMHAIVLKYHVDFRLMRSKKALRRARASYQRLVEAARG